MKEEIKNAVLEHTTLGFEDHGIFTCWLTLRFLDAEQGFGGYSMGGEYTHKVVTGILSVVGVDSWEKLRGSHIRVKSENGRIKEIGNFLEEKWFSFKIK